MKHLTVLAVLFFAACASAQTPTPTPHVEINLGSGSGSEGQVVIINGTLVSAVYEVAAVGNDISFDNTAFTLGLADCSAADSSRLLTGGVVDITGTTTTLRLFIVGAPINTDVLTPGIAYVCLVTIKAGAAPGSYVLGNATEIAQDPDGITLSPVIGADGSIEVYTPLPTSTPTATRTATPTITQTRTITATRTFTATPTVQPAVTARVYNREGRVLSVPFPIPTNWGVKVDDTGNYLVVAPVPATPTPGSGGGGGNLEASGATFDPAVCLDEEVATIDGDPSVSTAADLTAGMIVNACEVRTNATVSGGYTVGLAGAADLWGAAGGTVGNTNHTDVTLPGPVRIVATEPVVLTALHSSGEWQDNTGTIRVVCFCDEIGAATE